MPPRSASGKLVRELRTRYLMLLTATPVENRLQDLYEMVSLVAPGLLGTAAEFRNRHGGGSGGRPRDIEALRARTREVMVRHRRSEVALMLPQRLAETLLVSPSADEAQWYTDLTARIRREARTGSSSLRLTMRTLTRLAGSGPAAAGPTLTKIGWSDLADRARRIHRSQKDMVLLERLRRHAARQEKILVFTGFRQTLDRLVEQAAEAGIDHAVYHGSLPRAAKEQVISAFRDDVPVLLSTESAAGLRYAAGIPANARLETFSTSSTVVGDDRGLTSGTITTDVGSFPYTLHRTVQEQAVLVAEVLTYPLYPDGRINATYWWTAGRRTHARPKPTATGLDPVTRALIHTGTTWHGLAVSARAVAAWWRLTNEHDLSPTPEPAAMAAATHRLVAARAGDRGLFKEAANAYQADETAVRQADARIRKPLALGPDRTW